MMMVVTMMMMVRFRESGGRHKYNHGKQQGLFHSPMIGELKPRKSEWVRPSRYLMVMRFFHFPILALRLHSLEWSIGRDPTT
jgi:hypothetical protein